MEKTEVLKSKILSPESLSKTLHFWRFKKRKLVFTNGCFDILHLGHIDYLSRSSDLGDKLIIGLNSDASVKRIKGENRPINDQYSRAMVLASLFFVDAVVIFEEDTPYQLIEMVKPDLLVKGNDYEATKVVGYDIVNQYGGKVITLDLVEGYSTTSIEQRIKKV